MLPTDVMPMTKLGWLFFGVSVWFLFCLFALFCFDFGVFFRVSFCGGVTATYRVCAAAVRACSLSCLLADYIKEIISTVSEIKSFREAVFRGTCPCHSSIQWQMLSLHGELYIVRTKRLQLSLYLI